ncbi:MAG: sodium transport system ATP-binding protein [Pirellulaceae bacterium]|jgi:sodium transport system ATP-binding protein
MIRVDQLYKSFGGDEDAIEAVRDVSFEVSGGEVFGLLGPNGAGKTTTLRIIMGLLDPSAGYAEVDGFRTDRNALQVKSRIGLVSASSGVYQWLTVREMLLFFADMYGIDVARAEETLDRLAGVFELTKFIDQRCSGLSSGQRQRVNLTRALMHDPPALLLDEPTRGLDVIGTRVVFDYLIYLREQKKAVILSTHRLDEAERLCDRFALLDQGSIRYRGTLSELRAETGQQTLVDMFQQLVDANRG